MALYAEMYHLLGTVSPINNKNASFFSTISVQLGRASGEVRPDPFYMRALNPMLILDKAHVTKRQHFPCNSNS